MVMATEKQSGAVTSVFWDIKKCPVPRDFDALLVAPCIKRFLKKLGYFGPLTISAIGLLTDIADDVLRAVSSTGIVLHATPYGSNCVQTLIFSWMDDNPPPANIMLIPDPTVSNSYDLSFLKYHCGYNVINPYRYGPYSTKSLWKKFLLAGALEVEVEDKCIETDESASWFCHGCLIDFSCNTPIVCTTGQGVETFTTHLSSQEHAQLVIKHPSQTGLCRKLSSNTYRGPWGNVSCSIGCIYSEYVSLLVGHVFSSDEETTAYVAKMAPLVLEGDVDGNEFPISLIKFKAYK
ncbi:PREDICTED: uncharacterized protein LOC109128650 [Camelina sativa]|uniref:Uncharacterized protein LOC109128650 n=1 Tax=Camelina sativa TaxID=90675 RepID=A0ABM1QW63_CAMSA|nr:PREDICTED: uncharacterized protein LOC109128650 [Camelina sativa]